MYRSLVSSFIKKCEHVGCWGNKQPLFRFKTKNFLLCKCIITIIDMRLELLIVI